MELRLIMFREDGESKDFPIEDEKTVIGRQEECDLRIPLAEVSRKHAVVIMNAEEESVTIRDLGSANGTYVNNVKISEQELDAGDHIVIGPVVFTVQIDGEPTDVRPVKTRLESKAAKARAAGASADDSDIIDTDDLFDDEDDPISELEALTGTEDTAAIDLDDEDFLLDDDDDDDKK